MVIKHSLSSTFLRILPVGGSPSAFYNSTQRSVHVVCHLSWSSPFRHHQAPPLERGWETSEFISRFHSLPHRAAVGYCLQSIRNSAVNRWWLHSHPAYLDIESLVCRIPWRRERERGTQFKWIREKAQKGISHATKLLINSSETDRRAHSLLCTPNNQSSVELDARVMEFREYLQSVHPMRFSIDEIAKSFHTVITRNETERLVTWCWLLLKPIDNAFGSHTSRISQAKLLWAGNRDRLLGNKMFINDYVPDVLLITIIVFL